MVDLLGRVRSYTDAWGDVTTTTYDEVGREVSTSGPAGTITETYDANGNDGPTVIGGTTYATPTYDTAGRLTSVTYANGTKLDTVTRDASAARPTGCSRPRPARSSPQTL